MYVKATQEFLGNGLGDPRGRRFARVHVAGLGRGNYLGQQEKPTYGWVATDAKHAVLLDGMEKEIDSYQTVDLEATIKDLIDSSNAPRFRGSEAGIGPVAPALLLISGRTDLAERASRKVFDQTPEDPAYSMVHELTQNLRHAAADDLAFGRDGQGLERAHELARALTMARQMNLRSKMLVKDTWKQDADSADKLVEELQRRVDAGPSTGFDPEGVKGLDKPHRIAAMIKALDTISNMGYANPGGPMYMSDPLCVALSREGDDAIPPLLDCYEHDTRMTRFSTPSRMAGGAPTPVSVKNVAWAIIRAIWPASMTIDQNGPVPSADALREAWAKSSHLTENERWIEVLKNDATNPQNWVHASEYLVKPTNEIWQGYGMYSYFPNQKNMGMTGEPLRATRGTEISDLMQRRAVQMANSHTGGSMDTFACADALEVGHCLAKWDPSHALPCLKAVCSRIVGSLTDLGRYSSIRNTLGSQFGIVTADRARLGDPLAGDDYKALVGAVMSEPWSGLVGVDLYRPLWAAPNDPKIRKVGEEIMSALAEQLGSEDPTTASRGAEDATWQMFRSPVLGFRPYRQALIRGLGNPAVLGEAEIVQMGQAKFARYRIEPNGGGGNWNITKSEAARLLVGDKFKFTVADMLAEGFDRGYFKGIPAFDVAGKGRARKEQIARLVAWLDDDSRDWMGFVRSSPFHQEER
jgi:hypothetical protein